MKYKTKLRIKNVFMFNLYDCYGWRVKNRWKVLIGLTMLGVLSKPGFLLMCWFISHMPGTGNLYLDTMFGSLLGIVTALITTTGIMALILIGWAMVSSFKDKRTW